MRCHGNTVPVVVDNCNCPNSISNTFAQSYAKLYFSVPSDFKEIGQAKEQIQSKSSSCKDRFTVTLDGINKA